VSECIHRLRCGDTLIHNHSVVHSHSRSGLPFFNVKTTKTIRLRHSFGTWGQISQLRTSPWLCMRYGCVSADESNGGRISPSSTWAALLLIFFCQIADLQMICVTWLRPNSAGMYQNCPVAGRWDSAVWVGKLFGEQLIHLIHWSFIISVAFGRRRAASVSSRHRYLFRVVFVPYYTDCISTRDTVPTLTFENIVIVNTKNIQLLGMTGFHIHLHFHEPWVSRFGGLCVRFT